VSPQGWAFAIWAPIFLGELVFVTSGAFFLRDDGSGVTSVVKEASGGFIAAQIMQSLWAAAFRPRYKGYAVHVSAGLLSGIAYSLSRAHRAFTSTSSATGQASYGASEYLMYFLPMALHFGWTTAASLVNLNGGVAAAASDDDDDAVSAKTIAWAGRLSAVSATTLGVAVTMMRRAPVYGGVIAWRLLRAP